MPLRLPENFRKDIQGKDTNLIPVVAIGTKPADDNFDDFIFLSTNHISINVLDKIYDFKPLLLNIPTLKESIDIEQRKYKISNATLNISNYAHNGIRFSELVSDTSLINTECRIFWVSPTVSEIRIENLKGETDKDAFQAYFGTIRKYTHDDEKCQLVLEDRSQTSLHIDLPSANLGDNDDVPDKYKNKPIPMVYGVVPTSPCVISKSPPLNEYGINEGDIDLIIDSREEVVANQDLYIYDDGYNVVPPTTRHPSFTTDMFGYSHTGEQHNLYDVLLDSNIITLISNYVDNGDTPNPILSDTILCYRTVNKDKIDIASLRKRSTYFSDIELSGDNFIGNESWYTAIGRDFDTDSPYIAGTILRQLNNLYDENGNEHPEWGGESFLFDLEGTSIDVNYDGAFNGNAGGDESQACIVGMDGIIKGITLASAERMEGVLSYDLKIFIANAVSWNGVNLESYFLRVGRTPMVDGEDSPIYHSDIGEDYNQFTVSNHDGDTWVQELNASKSVKVGDAEKIFIYARPSSASWGGAMKIVFDKLTMVQFAEYKGVLDKDYYIDTYGRLTDDNFSSPNMPAVIKDILEEELKKEVNIEGVESDWEYAFTITEKINSKKLIEQLASASTYIPRFNSSGEFLLTEIPLEYKEPQHTVRERDVIDFSFSRTDAEKIYTKVILFYDYDYAKKDFKKRLSLQASEEWLNPLEGHLDIVDTSFTDHSDSYDFNFYGLKNDNSESTLIVEDERGKYIKDFYTAGRYTQFLLRHHANQHLKIKLKLPLKYLDIEIGDLIEFDEIIGGVKPYGINYSRCATFNFTFGEVEFPKTGHRINQQQALPLFLVTSTNKTLDYVEIESMMLHNLSSLSPFTWENLELCEECLEGFDDCGVCGGDNSTCADCEGTPNGTAVEDCLGNCGGDAVIDDCGVCNGDNDCECPDGQLKDCFGVCGGTAVPDCFGVCDGDAVVDECGVCGGNGIPIDNCDCNGNVVDECGVCGGGGATYECWNGELVCDQTECASQEGLGTCINTDINLGLMTEEDCMASTVHIAHGCDLPLNTIHVNPDGEVLYKLDFPTSGFQLSFFSPSWNCIWLGQVPPPPDSDFFTIEDVSGGSASRLESNTVNQSGNVQTPFWCNSYEEHYWDFGVGKLNPFCPEIPRPQTNQGSADLIFNGEGVPQHNNGLDCDPAYTFPAGCGTLTNIHFSGEAPTAVFINSWNHGVSHNCEPWDIWANFYTPNPLDQFQGTYANTCNPNNPNIEDVPNLWFPVIKWTPVGEEGSGDLNLDGKADIADIVLMGNYIAGEKELNETQKVTADILRNGDVSILDLINLANMIVGGAYSG